MMRLLSVPLALAAALAASSASLAQSIPPTTPGASVPVLPEAADKTLGMALMSAVVALGGQVISKAGVVSVARTDDGQYTIDFVRSIQACTPVATATPNGTAAWFIITDPNNRIEINTRAPNGDLSDRYFSLLVFCPQ